MRTETVTGYITATPNAASKPLLMTVKDLQEETKLGRTTIYGLIASGELQHIRIGRSLRIRRSDLEAWLSGKTGAGSADLPSRNQH